jgi:hypothetical protein
MPKTAPVRRHVNRENKTAGPRGFVGHGMVGDAGMPQWATCCFLPPVRRAWRCRRKNSSPAGDGLWRHHLRRDHRQLRLVRPMYSIRPASL